MSIGKLSQSDEETRKRVFTAKIVKSRISKPVKMPQSPRKKGLQIDCKDCPNECRPEKKFCPPESTKQ